MEIHAIGFRDQPVGGITDESVRELKGVLVPGSSRRGLISCLRIKPRVGGAHRLTIAVGQRRHGAPAEHLAHDRGSLQHLQLVGFQALQARRHQRLDRGGDRHADDGAVQHPLTSLGTQLTGVDKHAQHLLDEQRVALGDRADPGRRRVDPVDRRLGPDQAAASRRR